KSRYFTFSAVTHSDGPIVAMNPNSTNTGRSPRCQLGATEYHAIIPIRIRKEIRKSTKATTTDAVGTISRGKYTLLIKFAFPIRLLEASVRPLAKKLQGSIPANTISG